MQVVGGRSEGARRERVRGRGWGMGRNGRGKMKEEGREDLMALRLKDFNTNSRFFFFGIVTILQIVENPEKWKEGFEKGIFSKNNHE
jgi:hypothetical protein